MTNCSVMIGVKTCVLLGLLLTVNHVSIAINIMPCIYKAELSGGLRLKVNLVTGAAVAASTAAGAAAFSFTCATFNRTVTIESEIDSERMDIWYCGQ